MLLSILAVLVVLSPIIIFHEFGHYLACRLTGIRVNEFSFGFGKILWHKKKGDTDYQIRAIPFGGFVEPAGPMFHPEDAKEPPKPYEFAAKPWYSKFFMVVNGALFNYLLAAAIFAVLVFIQGMPQTDPSQLPAVVGNIAKNYPAANVDLQVGDRITAINGQKISNWKNLTDALQARTGGDLTVEYMRECWRLFDDTRDNRDTALYLIPSTNTSFCATNHEEPITNSASGQSVEQTEQSFKKFPRIPCNNCGGSLGKPYVRDEKSATITIKEADFNPKAPKTLGISVRPVYEKVAWWQAIGYGFYECYYWTKYSLQSIGKSFAKKKAPELAGPIGIVNIIHQAAHRNLLDFVWLIAMLSVAVGMFNLFPIPILDGGYALVYLWEGLTHKLPTEKTLNRAINVGMYVLILLVVYASYSDIKRIFFKPKTAVVQTTPQEETHVQK